MKPREVLDVDQIDLSDLEFWTRPWDEREGAFLTLRNLRPLASFEEPDLTEVSPLAPPPGPGYRAVTRHGDVATISRHPEIYLSGQGAVSIIDMPSEMLDYFSGMISTDNPRHARLRRIVSAAFSPRMIRSIEEVIAAVAKDVLNTVSGNGECDFATDVATQLPLKVICDMMGIPQSDYDEVLRCSNVILSNGDPEYFPQDQDPIAVFLGAAQTLTAMMQELSAYRVNNPTDDLTSALISTNIDGESLTHAELSSFFILLVVAGNETTRNAISHGLWALTQYPDQKEVWMKDVATITPSAVEEIVRWASPVIWMRRTVGKDTELSGVELKAGEKLLMFYNSANRDEAVFDNPWSFDVKRNPNPHFGFGAAGPHFCLGAHLARQEISVMFQEIFALVPDIGATGEPDRLQSNFINGIKHLSCTFTPHKPTV